MNRPAKGFTLIELLVVISIIGLLSSVVLVSLNTARSKARDARRLSDFNTVRTALELHYATTNTYPNTGGAWHGSHHGGVWIPGLAPTYVGSVPTDPKNTHTDGVEELVYWYNSDGANYCIQFSQENDCRKSPYYVGEWNNSCKLRTGTGNWCATH